MNTAIRTLSCGVAALLLAPGALAADANTDVIVGARQGAVPDIDYVLRAGVSYTDNLFFNAAGLEASTGAFTVGIDASGQRDTGRLTYETVVDLAYSAYFSDYDSQVFGGASFGGAYAFVPDMFFWNADISYNQVRQDLTGPLAPGNMGSQVTWSTGPELRMRMGSTMEARLEGHYQSASFSGSQTDNSTMGGRASLVHRMSPRARVALGASYDSVTYADDLVSELFDFDRQEAFASFDRSGPRDSLSAEVGYASVSGAYVDDSGPLFRGSYTRRMTPTLTGNASYVHEYPTSSAASFIEDPSVPGGSISDSTISAAPRIADTFDASLVMQRTRTDARLSYSWRREDSLAEVLGRRDFDEWRFYVSRRFTPKASGAFFAARSNENFTVFAEDSTETRFGAQLTILFGRSLGLDLRVEHRDRNSEDPTGSAEELAGGVFLRYSGAFGRSQALDNSESSSLR